MRLTLAPSACRAALQRAPPPPPPPLARAYSVLFLGSDAVSLPTLRALHESLSRRGPHAGLVTSLRAVCPSDRRTAGARGGGAPPAPLPVKAFCAAHGVRVLEVPPGVPHGARGDLLAAVPGLAAAAAAADLAVVVSFGYFVPPPLLRALRLGALNMHPSLLPRFRGAAPVAHTLLAGDARAGVSVMEVHPERFDAGAVLAQADTAVRAREGAAALTARLAQAGADAMLATIADLSGARARAEEAAAAAAAERRRQEAAGGGGGAEVQQPTAPKLHPIHGLLSWPTAAETETHAAPGARAAPAATGSTGGPKLPTAPPWASLTAHRVECMARAYDDVFGVFSFFEAPAPAAAVAGAAAQQQPGAGVQRRLRLNSVRQLTPEEAAELSRQLLRHGRDGGADAPGSLRQLKLPASAGTAADASDAARATLPPQLQLLLRVVDGWLVLERVQLESKAAQSGADFARGYRIPGAAGEALRLRNAPTTMPTPQPKQELP